MKRFAAIVLAFVMVFTIMAEPVSAIGAVFGLPAVVPYSIGDLYTPSRDNKPMHFLVNHWHAVDSDGNKVSASQAVSVEGYIEKLADSNYKITFVDAAGREIATPVGVSASAATGQVIINAMANEKESFGGFSVSAGHDAASINDTVLIISYNENIHLVKGHVFYISEKSTVYGIGTDETVSGNESFSSDDEQDTAFVYAYPKGTVESGVDIGGTPICDDNTYFAASGGNSEKAAQDYINKLLGEKKISINGSNAEIEWGGVTAKLETVKLYSTSKGLHTDKTASARGDGRTFDLDLEAWFVGENIASVGLILDASGSMAYTADDLKGDPKYRIEVKDYEPFNGKITSATTGTFPDEAFLTESQVNVILDIRNTDNSSLGISGYNYYIYDDRDSVKEPMPIGYVDANNVSDSNFKIGDKTVAQLTKIGGSGWYYVSFTSNFYSNYDNDSIGTGTTYAPMYGDYKYADKDYRVLEYVYSNGDYKLTYTNSAVVTALSNSNTSTTNIFEPIKFFVNEEGYLCCLYNSGSSALDRCAWSYVYKKDDNMRTKVETLQHALGLFATRLDEASPDTEISAVRFSNHDDDQKDKGMKNDDLDKLVMLDWTSDTKESITILNLARGKTNNAIGKTTGYDTSEPADESDGLNQYNYGLTGGTNTHAGLLAFINNLESRADSNIKNKYLIIFTDGKDSMLSKNTYNNYEEIKTAIEGLDAYKYANQLRKSETNPNGYEIITVMLASGSVKQGSDDYNQALQFLAALSQETDPGKLLKPTSDWDGDPATKADYYDSVYVAYKSEDLEKLFSEDIVTRIADQLENYTVQDYIDPRFDLVDADGVVWKLEKGGKVTVGKSDPVTIDNKNGLEITLTDSNDVEAERRTAALYHDADNDMYFLKWTGQTIPGSSENVSKLTTWNTTVTIRAKDDFIGGNAVMSNGNGQDQNLVYSEAEGANKVSGTTNANPDNGSDGYPSKGFPRTTVNVEIPTLEMTDGEQLIFMGETLTPGEVAEKLGEKIKDYWQSNKDSSNQWYWNYLDRYAAYSDGYTGFDDLLDAIISAESNTETEGSISFPYSYIPEVDGNTQTGGKDHEKDVFGYLVFSWTTKVEDGAEYPADGTTVDTDKRVSKLTVKYVPLRADNTAVDDDPLDSLLDVTDPETRADYNKDLVTEGAYEWNSDYKSAAGEPTIGNEKNDDGSERLAGYGTYTTNIVKGEIVLEMRIPADVFDYLKEHSSDGENTQIKYTADINRTYGGNTATVGTLTVDTTLGQLGDPITADDGSKYYRTYATFKLTSEVDKDDDVKGLPIGTYALSPNSSEAPTGITFSSIKILDIASEANNTAVSGKYNTYTAYHIENNEYYKKDFDKYYARYNKAAGQIYIGIEPNTETTYTDWRYGLAMIEVELNTGSISVRKRVDNPYGENISSERFEFTVEIFDENGEELNGEFPYDKYDASNEKVSADAEIHSGGTITLKDGERFYIKKLPDGAKIVITEEATGNIYTYDTTYTVDSGASNAYDGAAGVDITVGKDGLVVFKNAVQLGTLEISKNVSGVKPSSENTREFEFVVTLSVDGEALVGNYTYTVKTAKGDVTRTLEKTGEDGKYKLHIADGETAIINGLPVGADYTVEEISYDGYNTSYSVNDVDVESGETPSGKIAKSTFDSVEVSNTYRSGELTVSKTVTGDGGDENDEFTFIIKLSLKDDDGKAVALNGRYKYTGSSISGVTAPDDGYLNLIEQDDGSYIGTVTLKHGQSITIENLPEGTEFTVTEAEADKNGYKTAYTTTYTESNGDTSEPASVNTGKVVFDAAVTVAVNNDRGVNDLTILKTVKTAGNTALQADDKDEEFTFTINLTDANGKPISGEFTISGTYTAPAGNTITFTDGVAKVTLKHNERITISGLPNGTEYTVTEEENANYTASPTFAKGVIDSEGDQSEAEFTNTRKAGNISIRKVLIADTDVILDEADLEYLFEFEVIITDADGNELDGEFEYISVDGDAAAGTVSSGDSIYLSNGQTIKILNLPFGAKVTVTEIDDLTDDYAFKSLDIEGTTSVENELFETITANIVAEENGTMVYTKIKKKTAQLAVNKRVVDTNGVDADGDETEFTFNLTLTPAAGSELKDKYGYIVEAADGNKTTKTLELAVNPDTGVGTATITLKHGETATIVGLPIGTSYKVEEDESELGDYYELAASEETGGKVYDVVLATAKFVNTYTPETTEIEIPVTKEFTGNLPDEDANGDPADYTFNFNATLVKINGAETVGDARKTFTASITLPDDGKKNGSAVITDAYTAVGTYVYEITEEKGGKHGVTYDETVYYLTVEVGVKDNRLYIASYKVETDDGDIIAETEDISEVEIPFENSYAPDPVSVNFEGNKELVGLTMSDDFRNVFEFTLTAENGAPMPEEANGEDSYIVTNEYHDIVFGDIEYTEAGTYEYTITENGFVESYDNEDIEAQMTMDGTAVHVTVEVEDKDGVLEATVTYNYGEDGGDSDDFTFTNVYTAPITVNIPVTKILEGNLPAGSIYTFSFRATLTKIDEEEIDESEQDPETINVTLPTIEGEKFTTADFEFTYDKPGTYVYEITETKGTTDGVEYDETVYIVTVTVDDEDGDGVLTYDVDTIEADGDGTAVEFTNTYVPSTDAVTPVVNKVFEGGTLLGDDFTFTLKLVSENGEYVKGLEDDGTLTAKNSSDGDVTFGEIEFTKDGIYTFEVREHIPEPEDDDYNSLITYDTDKVITITYTVTDDNGELKVSAPAYGASGNTFRNILRQSGDLNITKFVTGTGGETDKDFTFKATLTAPEGVTLAESYEYETDNEEEVIFNTDDDGKLIVEFSLKHGESITIKGLPEGTGYEIAENEANDDGYVTTADEASGTIPANNIASATFVNERNKRSLIVEKIVAGADLSEADKKSDSFTFTVYLDIPGADPDKSYSYKTDNETYSELIFTYDAEIGEFKSDPFTLKHGESIAIYYLPVNAAYTVIEAKDSRYTTVSSGEEGTIPASGDVNAVFVNTKLNAPSGTLTVYKVVAGDGVVGNEKFEFTVSLNIPDADIEKTYSYKTDNAAIGDIEFKYDPDTERFVAPIELGHLESVSIIGLPAGADYSVTEKDYSGAGFTTAATGGLESAANGNYTVEGTIPVSGGASAVFVNTKHIAPTGSLRITKTVAGTAEYNGEAFGFTVMLDVPDNVTLKNSYDTDWENVSVSFTYDDVSGKYISNKIELAGGESITIYGLPEGVTYTVEETDDLDYDVIATDYEGSIAANATANAVFVNVKNEEPDPIGSLMVTKTVVGENADPINDSFRFTVTLYSIYTEFEKVVYDWNETVGDIVFNGGVAEFYLKHGESVVLTGLPAGITYVVEEDDYTEFGYTTFSDGEIGMIPENGVAVAAFENANPVPPEYTGSLVVTKVVTGNDAETGRDFHFTVTLYSVYSENEEEKEIFDLTGTYGDLYFENGTAQFTLKHGESIAAVGLPAGIAYEVVEAEANEDGYTTTSSNEVGLIPDDGLIVASFDNERSITATGDLTVVKTVTGTDGDKNYEFAFEITLTDPFTGANIIGKYRYTGSKSGIIENGFGTVKLKDGESITISDLPVGTVYKVVEVEANENRYVTTAAGDSSSITEDGATASFINNRDKETGSLTVVKVVTNGEEEDLNKPFSFTVTLYSDFAKTKVYDLTGTYGDMYFENGVSNVFTLKHGDSKTATDLPVGITYEVAETENDGYTVTSVGETGSIAQSAPAVAVFVNDKDNGEVLPELGSLTVAKAVMGNDTDLNDEFSFSVTVTDENGKPVSGEYGDMTFDESGIATFTLKHGESKTATNLPVGAAYKVEETDSKGYKVTSANASGTITANETITAMFTNEKNKPVEPETQYGNLAITKTVQGGSTSERFEFTVVLLDSDGNPLAGSYSYIGTVSGTITSGGTVWLGDGDWIVISGIPAGTRYKVTETVRSGYTSTSTNSGNTIVANGTQTVDFVNKMNTIPTPPITPDPGIQEGDLTITKEVDFDGDKNQEFEFVIYLTDEYGRALSGVFYYSGDKTGLISNGGIFTLKHGEKIVINGLPVGTRYTVSEFTPEGYFAEASGDVGVITAYGNTARFINHTEIDVPTQAGYVENDDIDEVGGTTGASKTGVNPLGGAAIGLVCIAAIALLKRSGSNA